MNPTVVLPSNNVSCTSLSLRQEWSSVTQDVRDNYVAASLCLISKSSRIGLNSTLYDDFSWVHNQLAGEIHFVAAFLPWHRYFIYLHEKALQECGYKGTLLYLDWTLISADPVNAAAFSPTTGVGGSGNTTTNCVDAGPYAILKPAYFGGFEGGAPGCLTRRFNNDVDGVPSNESGQMHGTHYSPEAIDSIMKYSTFGNFSTALENEPHNAFHAAIGGDLSPQTSPNDPLFYLHHTQIDRLWWLWQQKDAGKRKFDYSGLGGSWASPEPPTTSAVMLDKLRVLRLGPDVVVRDMMGTMMGPLCYRY